MAARRESVQYRIVPVDPALHLFDVTLIIAKPAADGQLVSLPAWIPGSYMIREFARNIVNMSARCDGRKLRLTKLDKHSWQAAPCKGELQIQYQVYAWDLSVRAAHLDQTHGFFNGTSVFLKVHGRNRCRTSWIFSRRKVTPMPHGVLPPRCPSTRRAAIDLVRTSPVTTMS